MIEALSKTSQSYLDWCKKAQATFKSEDRVEICRIRAETFDSFKKSTRKFDKVRLS